MNKKTQKPTTPTPVKLLPHTPVIGKANALAFQQDADKEATNMTWMIIAILFLVGAILLAITSITLGTMLCVTRKCLISASDSKLTPHQG